MQRGVVFNVQRFSTHDGPGIRSTVFFKGCPLRCPWCHNPEGLEPEPQVVWREDRCVGCGECTEVCPVDCDSRRCTACARCVDVCPTGARQRIGREVGVDQLMAELLADRAFFDRSGGGITFSGGEPLAQPEFLLGCLRRCRAERLHSTVDTSGFAPREVILDVARLADLVLYDVKTLDAGRHVELTGVPLQQVLDNLHAVATVHRSIWIRVPVVPGLTGAPDDLHRIAELAASLPSVQRLDLLPYHRTATGKRELLDLDDPLRELRPPDITPLRRLASALSGAGIVVTTGG